MTRPRLNLAGSIILITCFDLVEVCIFQIGLLHFCIPMSLHMEKEGHQVPSADDSVEENKQSETLEIVLFRVNECYVYLIPPRKSAASYRADDWNVNKWAWEGALRVVTKGVECLIKLEDKKTGELYAQAFLRHDEPHPVEPVIDSSRYFVLRIEENISGNLRHAFIGIGFRERTHAYDFQAALHDHMKYLNKKKAAKEMELHYQQTSSVDYSLKDGETLVLQLSNKGSRMGRLTSLERGISTISLNGKSDSEVPEFFLKPPPPPPVQLSATLLQNKSSKFPANIIIPRTSSESPLCCTKGSHLRATSSSDSDSSEENVDFGDFQKAD